MVENVEFIVISVVVTFFLIILNALILFLYNGKKHNSLKKNKEQTLTCYQIKDKKIEAEIAKVMKAIDNRIIANEKQVNHAENHNDIKEVERFKNFNDFLNMKVIGEVVYGKY